MGVALFYTFIGAIHYSTSTSDIIIALFDCSHLDTTIFFGSYAFHHKDYAKRRSAQRGAEHRHHQICPFKARPHG